MEGLNLSSEVIYRIFNQNLDKLFGGVKKQENIEYIDKIWRRILDTENHLIETSHKAKKHLSKKKVQSMTSSLRDLEEKNRQTRLVNWKLTLPFLDTNDLNNEVDNRFYNLNVMKAVSSIVDSLNESSSANPKAGVDPITPNENFNIWLSSMKRMGAESAFGFAIKSSLGPGTGPGLVPIPASDLFVIKAPRNPEADDTLLHELFVGIFGTNQLREFLPNFAYIYGGFKCSPPFINSQTKEVENFCLSDSNKVNYIVYENVSREEKCQGSSCTRRASVDMREFVKTCSVSEYLQVLLQICFALRKALKVCDFTHYDLHDSNVIVRGMPNYEGYLKYEDEDDREIYLGPTKHIGTIIDFGGSHIKVGGKNYGYITPALASRDVSPKRSFPLYDVYKFIGFSLYSMWEAQNFACFNIVKNILIFFNKFETPEEILKKQRNILYALPYTADIADKKVTLDHFIKFLRTKFAAEISSFLKPTFPVSESGKLFSCGANCKSERQIGKEMVDLTKTNDMRYFANMDIRIFSEFITSLPKQAQEMIMKKYLFQDIATGVFSGVNTPWLNQLTDASKKIDKYIADIEVFLRRETPSHNFSINEALSHYPDNNERIKIAGLQTFVADLNKFYSKFKNLKIYVKAVRNIINLAERRFGGQTEESVFKHIDDVKVILTALETRIEEYDVTFDGILWTLGIHLDSFKEFAMSETNRNLLKRFENYPEIRWLLLTYPIDYENLRE